MGMFQYIITGNTDFMVLLNEKATTSWVILTIIMVVIGGDDRDD